MFSGIVKATSKIIKANRSHGSLFLTIKKPNLWGVKNGDSISVNGVCLTAAATAKNKMAFELMPQTLKTTTFGKSIPKSVNLEPALKIGDTLDGHLILGHIDTIGRIAEIKFASRSKIYEVKFAKEFSCLVAPKGSVAVDGISLTVADCGTGWLTVSLVDYTLKHTTIGSKRNGDLVNLEFDIIAKYLNQAKKYGTRSQKRKI